MFLVKKHEAAAAYDQEQGVGLYQQEEEEGVRHLTRGRDQGALRCQYFLSFVWTLDLYSEPLTILPFSWAIEIYKNKKLTFVGMASAALIFRNVF